MESVKERNSVWEINTLENKQKVLNIGIGDIVIAYSNSIMKTNLGSCVAVILYDTVNKIGGMIHIIMPSSESKIKDKPGRFADSGIPILIQKFKESGASMSSTVISISGGNNVITNERLSDSIFSKIGKSNIEAVKNILTAAKLKFKELSVGQNTGTAVSLDTNTGMISVRNLKKTVVNK